MNFMRPNPMIITTQLRVRYLDPSNRSQCVHGLPAPGPCTACHDHTVHLLSLTREEARALRAKHSERSKRGVRARK